MENKPKAIIMTVGLPGDQGGDVLDALQLDLNALKPETLALIATTQSQANAQRMVERSGLPRDHCEVVTLSGAHDIDEVFRATNALIQRLEAQGYSADQIAINYTSGTKVMGSGAVLSAVFNKIMELRYITGLASVREGPERARHRLLTTKPGAVFAYQDLLAARSMLLDLRFRSAHAALGAVEEDLLTPEERHLLTSLSLLTRAYGEWDNFYPNRFLTLYSEVDFSREMLEPFRLGEGQREAVEKTAAEMENGLPGPYVIVDLFNNAGRRLALGRTEDAMARLYRALEMLGQWVLARDFKVDTNNVDTRRIPPRDRVRYEALRSMEDGLVRIGFHKTYELLGIFGSPIGVTFTGDPVMREFLESRSESILAHGLRPASREEAQRVMDHGRELLRLEIAELDDLEARLQFPWLLGGAELSSEIVAGT
jgi:CRISPR-associated protein (TIGR02710 family)